MSLKRPSDTTRAFYDANAHAYSERTFTLDMSQLYAPFLERLPPGATILDAGCGPGRDIKAFTEMDYKVKGMDASASMVTLARQHAKGDVIQQTFQEISWENAFDGIWACASLLHVPRTDMPEVFARLARALKPGGVWYLSFKYGNDEWAQGGRHFTNYTENSLQALLEGFPELTLVKWWKTSDIRPGREEEFWLNALITCQARKTGYS